MTELRRRMGMVEPGLPREPVKKEETISALPRIEIPSGTDLHHVLEAVFKAFGVALDQATQVDPRRKDIPSTKGIIVDE